jgi:hypothetical protein
MTPTRRTVLFAALLLALDSASAADETSTSKQDPNFPGLNFTPPPEFTEPPVVPSGTRSIPTVPPTGGAGAPKVKTTRSNIHDLKQVPPNIRHQSETANGVRQLQERSGNIAGTNKQPDTTRMQELNGNVLHYHTLATPTLQPRQKQASAPSAAIPIVESKPVPATPAAPPAPDEKPLWNLLGQHRYTTLLGQIERLRGDYPLWRPPAQLLSLAREGELRARIQTAVDSGDTAGLIVLAREHPSAFGCSNAVAVWALADAYTKLQETDQAETTARMLLDCPNEDERLATLYKAREWLPADHWEALLALEQNAAHTAQGERKFRQLRYDYQLEQLARASNDKAFEQAVNLLATLAPEIEKRKDIPASLLGGWSHFQLQQYDSAGEWFQRVLDWDSSNDEAHRGLALTAYQQHRYEIALREAQTMSPRAEGRNELIRDILVAQAQQADTAGEHARALELFEAAQQQAPLPRFARLLAAWNRMELGRLASAADQFVTLYQEQPDTDSAQGILAAFTRSKRDEELDRIAQSEPLLGLVRRYRAERAFADKQFLQAHTLAPELYGSSGGAGAPQIAAFSAARSKVGDPGLSRMDLRWAPSVEAAMPAGAAGELRLRVDRISIDSGTLPSNAQLGSAPAVATPYAFTPQTRMQGWQPRLIWHNERRDGTVTAELGGTPDGGAVASTWTGRLGYSTTVSTTALDVSVARQPIRETLLSYTGLRDPYGGGSWGRVMRNGVQMLARTAMNERWSVNTLALAESIDGEQVASNRHAGLEVGLSYALPWSGFDYAVVGADAGIDHYDRNLSHFTLGHGGYFSPQSYWRAGPFLDMRTAENRRWILHARLSAGRTANRQDAAPLFPLNPDGRSYDGSTGIGNAFDIELGGVWRLGDTLQLGLQLTKRHSPQYDDYAVLGFVRLLFERRSSVLSSDLPGAAAAQLY